MLENYQAAPIAPAEKALFAFIEKVNRNSPAIRETDTERMRQAGWTDEAIYDAINVCALFNFYNRWIDAAGVHEMSPESHRLSGQRLAKSGYVMAEEKVAR